MVQIVWVSARTVQGLSYKFNSRLAKVASVGANTHALVSRCFDVLAHINDSHVVNVNPSVDCEQKKLNKLQNRNKHMQNTDKPLLHDRRTNKTDIYVLYMGLKQLHVQSRSPGSSLNHESRKKSEYGRHYTFTLFECY